MTTHATTRLWTPPANGVYAAPSGHVKDRACSSSISFYNPSGIAIRQPEWETAVREAALETVSDVLWGNWCGRSQATSYRDMVIVRKPG